jgi:hypothetical protein
MIAGLPPHQAPSLEIPANGWPLNQAAKRWLLQAKVSPDPNYLYLVQLLNLGFEENLTIPGQGQRYRADLELAAGQLFAPELKPVEIMEWLLSNPNGPDQPEQSQTLQSFLEDAKSWEEAAQSLMEWFYDLKAGQDPYYRPAASHRD